MPDEVYALGIRNGWRMSADAERGEVYVVDERFSFAWAEVNRAAPAADFGWQAQAGRNCFTSDPTVMQESCLKGKGGEVLAAPIVEYGSQVGVVMSGAILYRGSAIPDLPGKMIVIDSGVTSNSGGPQGVLLAAVPQPAGTDWLWPYTQLELSIPVETAHYFWSLGQDSDGELYLLTTQVFGGGENADGKVFKIVPAP
jgi:glucose/arabinose dehydrogenase